MKLLLLLLLLLLPLLSHSQTITTVAGTGVLGFSPDGSLAATSNLQQPYFVTVDGNHNIYFIEFQYNIVRKINSEGILTTVAGTGTAGYSGDGGNATAAQLNIPTGLALDKAGNLLIADNSNNCIRKVDTSGTITTIAGTPSAAGYNGDGMQATAAKLHSPQCVAVDKRGNIYITDNYRIRKIDTMGIISTIAGIGPAAGYSGDGGPATAAQLSDDFGITIDSFGNVYLAERGNRCVRKIDTSGIITTIAGNGTSGYHGDGGPATAAAVSAYSVTADSAGNLYITDMFCHCIRMVNTSGIISTIAGTGTPGFNGDGIPATVAVLREPVNVAFDPSGNLYFADGGNYRIRLITYPSAIRQPYDPGSLEIYPSPAFSQLAIYASQKITTMVITNSVGHVVYRSQHNTSRLQVNVADLPNGVYFININDNVVRKFVKG